MGDDLESLLRWAFYLDYGMTPEQAWARFFNREDRSSWHFSMSLETMLSRYESHIRQSGREQNIDARAIAGAIAWEYEENLLGRFSDYSPLFNNGAGWGSMHEEVARELRPDASDAELFRLRMSAHSAITLIAEHMNQLASRYFELTRLDRPDELPEAIWIRDSPVVLVSFYQAGDGLVRRSAARHRNSEERESGRVTLDIQTDMGVWLHRNLARFARFATTPTLATGYTLVRVGTRISG